MLTKILVITHKNFTKMFHEVNELLNLPMELKILEAGFGEVNQLIELNSIMTYDLVIASGAHLELIQREFQELMYTVPLFPLRFTESDLVKALVQAKAYDNKVLLMYFNDETYDLDAYREILGMELVRLAFKDLKEARKQLDAYKNKGYKVVVGTSAFCELAREAGCQDVMLYSIDSMKLELMKAYQLATTRNKMMRFAYIKEALFEHMNGAVFLLDPSGIITDASESAIYYCGKRSKHELIGESIDSLLDRPLFLRKDHSLLKRPVVHQTPRGKETTAPVYLNSKLDGYITVIDRNLQRDPSAQINRLNKPSNPKYQFKDIIVFSPPMKKVIVKAQQYAKSAAPVFIYGETGTGKELLAHSIHQHSSRCDFPFLPVNCAAIPQNILESELFGYEEGAFTGAKKGGKPGFFEMAQGGTIFLDEIGEIPLDIQTKLLRVLQEKEVIRLGGRHIVPLNVRIISATNKSLPDLISQRLFREDLYYRINVLQINVPSLRERAEDILPIFKHLLLKYGVSAEHADYLCDFGQRILSYPWPGNIRELENFVQRLTALTSISTTTYDLAQFFKDVMSEHGQSEKWPEAKAEKQAMDQAMDLDRIEEGNPSALLADRERSRIIHSLLTCQGNKLRAAKELGMSRTTLWRKMNEYQIR